MSILSFLLILAYSVYEILYPLAHHERIKKEWELQYTHRYNRNRYEEIKPAQ
jgi:hypothetical protein